MLALRARLLSLVTVCSLLAAGSASAIPLDGYWMWVNSGGTLYTATDLDNLGLLDFAPSTVGGTWSLNNSVATTNGTVLSWDSTFDTDPFVTNNVSIINSTASVQTYVIGVTSPIVPQLPNTLMNGSIGISVTNDPSASATLGSSAPNAVYTARIDGASVATLANDPYTLTCAGAFCSTTQNFSFGSPTPILGPGATSTIGITLRFTLTPGDQASITSVFNVVAVPEPASGLLLVGGLVGLALTRRGRGSR